MYPNPYANTQQQPGIGFQFQPQGNSLYPPVLSYPPAPSQAPGYPPVPGFPQPEVYTASTGYPPALSYSPAVAPQPSPGYPQYPGTGLPQYPTSTITASYPSANITAPAYQQQQTPSFGGCPSQASTAGQSYGSGSGRMQQYQETPTVFEGPFDATNDAQILRKAMKGFGTDEAAIIGILGKRTNNQRKQISRAFKTCYGRDIIKDFKSELSGRFEDVIVALMTPRFEYLAKRLNKAISGIGTREQTLVDILCTANNQEIREINAVYARIYRKSLESDLTGDTSGYFRKLLVSLNTAARNEDRIANPAIATQDAQELYSAGEKRMGTDEITFTRILATRSFSQIRLMLHEYERITGHSFDKAIQNEFSGDIKTGLLAVVKSARNRAAYFAERLYQSMVGMGTNDEDLIFIVVTRSEIDMENIKQEYNKIYHKSLAQAIASDTSGDYKKILLALIGM